ncbi:hypothetical protein FQA39_LY02271 [Lamprigera yunnana]|nr:hypothetical protein FQA39_LY02271 [Lamprigera yunnana]
MELLLMAVLVLFARGCEAEPLSNTTIDEKGLLNTVVQFDDDKDDNLENSQLSIEDRLQNDISEVLKDLNLLPRNKSVVDTKSDAASNVTSTFPEKKLENDISDALKELNLLPKNATFSKPDTEIQQDINISFDSLYPSKSGLDRNAITTTPSYGIVQSNEQQPSIPQTPVWGSFNFDKPLNHNYDMVNNNDISLPFFINHALTYGNKPISQSNPNPSLNKQNMFIAIPKNNYYSSNFYSAHQSHGVQTLQSFDQQKEIPWTQTSFKKYESDVPTQYSPTPSFSYPQNPFPWIQNHQQQQHYQYQQNNQLCQCPCQNFYSRY